MTSDSPVPATAFDVCSNCGEFVEKLDFQTGWCEDCSKTKKQVFSNFLQSNADHIEHYVLQGFSVSMAIRKVATEVRPVCAVCGKPMRRAKRTAVICRRNAHCRKVSRRYVYLYTERGLTKAEALAKAIIG